LAHMFGTETPARGQLDGIYESDDRRAQQTAAPLLERLHRAPVVFNSAAARSTAVRALREHAGGTLLVVASGSALPEMLDELTGSAVASAAEEVDFVYVVSVPSIGRAHLARFRL
jgi:broad specificity phosphatase PhoE